MNGLLLWQRLGESGIKGHKMQPLARLWIVLALVVSPSLAVQTWGQQPGYQEVNPGGQVKLPCVINDVEGQCRWEKDGSPVGMFPNKYELAGEPSTGDCSLLVKGANLEYDDGVWQCQVTPSSFQAKDALISEGAQLVVRGEK